MKPELGHLVTSGSIAKELAISDARVKKAIKELGLRPKAKRGVCNYYSRDVLPKIKDVLEK